MKVLQRIAFLMLVTLTCSNIHAGKNGYKQPDLRKQRQQALHAAKYLEKASSKQSNRFERRHPTPTTSLTSKQRMMLLGLTVMMLAPMVVAAIPKDSWPSSVKEASYQDWGPEYKVFGPCEDIPRDERICCKIGPNCTVTCYALDPCCSVSFGPGGIVNDQSEYRFNLTRALLESKKMCAERPHTKKIASETFNLLRQLAPKYLQNINGSFCTIENPMPKGKFFSMLLPSSSNNGKICSVTMTDISNTKIIPAATTMIDKLVDKFNLPPPQIFIYSDSHCDPSNQEEAFMLTGRVRYSDQDDATENIVGIAIPFSSLLKYSDDQLLDIFGHEIHHLKQFQFDGRKEGLLSITTGNNRELEADIASVLANKNPCLAIYIKESLWDKRLDDWSLFLEFTKENSNAILNLIITDFTFKHPPHPIRMSVILHIYEHFKRAQELLTLTAE